MIFGSFPKSNLHSNDLPPVPWPKDCALGPGEGVPRPSGMFGVTGIVPLSSGSGLFV